MIIPLFDKATRGLDRAFVIDLVVRAVLAVFFALSAGVYIKNVIQDWRGIDIAHMDLVLLGRGLAVFASGFYTLMIACLYVLRKRPLNKFAGLWPAMVAVLGGFLIFGLIWLKQRTDLPPLVQIVASFLILTGNGFAIYILTHLGRSFSIIPESRALVVKGPYRMIRHPLYLAEAVATLGMMILFLSPTAVALVAVQLALQLGRIHYEERVLRETFPEYAVYAKKTARLVPGVY